MVLEEEDGASSATARAALHKPPREDSPTKRALSGWPLEA